MYVFSLNDLFSINGRERKKKLLHFVATKQMKILFAIQYFEPECEPLKIMWKSLFLCQWQEKKMNSKPQKNIKNNVPDEDKALYFNRHWVIQLIA